MVVLDVARLVQIDLDIDSNTGDSPLTVTIETSGGETVGVVFPFSVLWELQEAIGEAFRRFPSGYGAP